MQWASVGHGRCRALQRTERDLHRDRTADAARGAPTRASHALLPTPYSLLYAVGVRRARQMLCLAEDREGFTQGSRGICRARRAHARQPRTTFFSLLPIPYFTQWASVGHGRCRALQRTERVLHRDRAASAVRGAPTRASHALFPSPYFLKKRVNGGREIVCHSGEQDARMIPGYS